ncbi:hypothetical protein [uncultured Massilia sp.]|uniref:hypothetical protein n=1 Tax=uncultured Massilia sp. TaxID=169973 RepID=UPI0025DBC5F2|nr:hypothetical protein [uncultured Massilia sp.]
MNATLQQQALHFGDAVAAYLAPWKDTLKDFDWPLTPAARTTAAAMGFGLGDGSGGTAATNALRAAVAARARACHGLPADTRAARMAALCSFVIRDWGALRSNRDATIAGYAARYTGAGIADLSAIASLDDLQAQAGCTFPVQGISSWSKWLSFVWSDWALVYDARIAFALNTIHFLHGVHAPAVPVPQGRDRLLSTLDTQSLAALGYLQRRGKTCPAAGAHVAVLADWIEDGSVADASAYAYYLAVMRRVRDVLGYEGPFALTETEMLLFHVSNKQVVHALLAALSDTLAARAA